MGMWISFALGLAATCPSCSLGGATVMARHAELRAMDGAATLSVSFDVEHGGDGPAGGIISATIPPATGAIVDAEMRTKDRTLRTSLAQADDAVARFQEFQDALQGGGQKDNPHPKERPFGGVLVERDQMHDVVYTHFALPKEFTRAEVSVRFRLASFVKEGQTRIQLPLIDYVDWRDLGIGELVLVHVVDEDTGRAIAQLRAQPSVKEPEARYATMRPAVDSKSQRDKGAPSDIMLLRAELDLPAVLQAAPEAPYYVFVLDLSVSMRADRVAAAFGQVSRTLNEAPQKTRYAVISMGRTPTVLVGPWTPRSLQAPLLRAKRAAIVENGSDAIAALRLAQGIASDVPRRDEARIVFLTDVQLPFAQEGSPFHDRLAKGSVTHVVQINGRHEGNQELLWERDFDAAHSVAAHRTGGTSILAWAGRTDKDGPLSEYLVQPTRLDRPALFALRRDLSTPGLDAGGLFVGVEGEDTRIAVDVQIADRQRSDMPRFVVQGEGVGVTLAMERKSTLDPSQPSFTGWLWGKKVAVIAQQSSSTHALLPVLATTTPIGAFLPDSVVAELSMLSGAVSRTTSRLGLPLWRPPYQPSLGGRGCGCSGVGNTVSCSSRCGGRYMRTSMDDERQALVELLRRWEPFCGEASGQLAVEIGDREVLAVEAPEEAVARCYVDRLWAARLDVEFHVLGQSLSKESRRSLFVRHRSHLIDLDFGLLQ